MVQTLRWATILFTMAAAGPVLAAPARTRSPPGAAVYFQSPAEGQTADPVVVRAGLTGMGVAAAGATADNAGYHNLLVDTPLGDLSKPLPQTAGVVRLADGETEVPVKLVRGWHQLQLVLTDGRGMNFDPPVVSKTISIYVRRK